MVECGEFVLTRRVQQIKKPAATFLLVNYFLSFNFTLSIDEMFNIICFIHDYFHLLDYTLYLLHKKSYPLHPLSILRKMRRTFRIRDPPSNLTPTILTPTVFAKVLLQRHLTSQ